MATFSCTHRHTHTHSQPFFSSFSHLSINSTSPPRFSHHSTYYNKDRVDWNEYNLPLAYFLISCLTMTVILVSRGLPSRCGKV